MRLEAISWMCWNIMLGLDPVGNEMGAAGPKPPEL